MADTMTRNLLPVFACSIVLLILCAGCTQPGPAANPPTDPRQNSPPVQVRSDLQNAIDNEIRAGQVPGIQIEVAAPAWTWNSAAGNASPVTGQKAEPGMRFLIASVSKTFTSVAVQKLAEEGKLSLDDPIDRWLDPDLVTRIPNGHQITIRQLLSHTSGIADYDESAINLEELKNPDVPVPYQAGLDYGLKHSPLSSPRTNYTYSNVNYILLTLIVDKAAGIPYEDYATRTIIIPAGMNDTFFQHTNHIPGPHMRATMPGADGSIDDYTDLYILFDRGAGDIVSTAADLNRFHRALRDGKLISRTSLAIMETPDPLSGASGYGLGYQNHTIKDADIEVRGHTGGYPGSFTFWYYLPAEDTYVTYNINSVGSSPANIGKMRVALLNSIRKATTGVAQAQTPESAVKMSVPFGPIPVASPDGVNLAYELELVPEAGEAVVVDAVEVIDPATGTVVYAPEEELLPELWHPASVPPPTDAELKTGTGKLRYPRISLWFKTGPDSVPDRLVHTLTLNRSAEGKPPLTITGGEVVVRKDLKPVVVGSPLKGSGWMAMETTSPLTHHFSAQITINGVTRVPQRYAQDWVLLDPVTGQAASGNASLAKNYFGYGKEIYSVADGTVVFAKDELEDIETIYSTPPVTFDTAAGNAVIVDIGNQKYACYAHMIPGSITVKEGDRIREGQVIGRMGNSGNSDLPHLHFQVVTGSPSFLGAEGYPHVYRSFDRTGMVNVTRAMEYLAKPGYSVNQMWSEFGDFTEFAQQPVSYKNMLMENNDITRLP
ncbi:MAG: serine hydrolase [Methanomicrobiales archaeon]|nr:serine hydrolase [Methanomicrobiales archaeon]